MVTFIRGIDNDYSFSAPKNKERISMAKKIGEIEITQSIAYNKKKHNGYNDTVVFVEITATRQGKSKTQQTYHNMSYDDNVDNLRSIYRKVDGGKYKDENIYDQVYIMRHLKAEAELCGTKDDGFDFKMTKLIATQKNGPPDDEPMDEDTQDIDSSKSDVLDEVLEEDDGREEDIDDLFDDYESVI